MNPEIIFAIAFIALALAVAFLSAKYGMLRDITVAGEHKPYSWSRVQLAWWTVIVLSSFIAILFTFNQAPTLSTSTVVLLGISAGTTAMARVIDVSATTNVATVTSPVLPDKSNLFVDILSDQNSVSVSRFQTVIFNAAFGIWFIVAVLEHLHLSPDDDINSIMPVIETQNLVLLGLSSATYAALKTTENKQTVDTTTTAATTPNLEEEPLG
jgi:hypothetical protein